MTRLLRDPILPGRDASLPGSKSPDLRAPTLQMMTAAPVTTRPTPISAPCPAGGCLETRNAIYASTVYADFGRFERLGLEPA